MAAEAKTTTDHKEIQKWAEERQGKPSSVKGTEGKGNAGLLRINFPGYKEGSLDDISWEDFFAKFDENKLAFLYQEKTATGKISRFNKIISRETAESVDKKPGRESRKRAAPKAKSKA